MSIETIQPIGPNVTPETTQLHEQPLDRHDATTLPQQESSDSRDREVSYLSSAAIIAHERALLSDMQAEAVALAEEVRQAEIALARIHIDFLYVKDQISDLGRPGVPQMIMQRDLEQAYEVAVANKASLVALHSAKTEEINAIKAHQNRREWSMSEDY